MPDVLQIALGAGALAGALLIWNILLEWRLRRLARGADGKSLESHIAAITREYEEFGAFKKAMGAHVASLDTRIKSSTRGIGVVRFNPFAGSGLSKPSFAAAFIAENGDGLVISTLHARESVSIFSKHIENFTSEQELSEEEAQALEKARKSLHTQ